MNEKNFIIISVLGIIGIAGALYYFFSFDRQFKTILKELKELKEKTINKEDTTELKNEISGLDENLDTYLSNLEKEFEILKEEELQDSDKIVELDSNSEFNLDKQDDEDNQVKEDKEKKVNDILNFIYNETEEVKDKLEHDQEQETKSNGKKTTFCKKKPKKITK
jgi:hypothetical protein